MKPFALHSLPVLTLAIAGSLAHAAPTSEWHYIGAFDQPFESGATAASSEVALADSRRQAAASQGADSLGSLGLSGSLDVTLWNFIVNIRAQQQGNHFQFLQSNASSIQYTLGVPRSYVPLPPSSWLFLGGIAALAMLVVRRGASGRPMAEGLGTRAI